jgi:benzoate-CoA ligase
MAFNNNLPKLFNAADYFVDRNIREGRANKLAVMCEGRKLTYGQIQAGMNRIGNGLRSLGVRMEERVALLLLDTEFYPQAFFGAIKIGAVPICLNTLMRPKDYAYFLNDSRARVLMVDHSLFSIIEAIKPQLIFLEHVIVVGGETGAGRFRWKSGWPPSPRHWTRPPRHLMTLASGFTVPGPPGCPRERSISSMTWWLPAKRMAIKC